MTVHTTPAVVSSTVGTRTPSRLTVLLAAAHAEWTKLRTVRSTFWALGLAVLGTVGVGPLFTALLVNRWDQRTPEEIAMFAPCSTPSPGWTWRNWRSVCSASSS